MKNPTKIRVAVLYGGRSPEHEVSVSSAANVMANLDRAHFEVVPIKIDKQGTWFLEDQTTLKLTTDQADTLPQKLFTPEWINEPEAVRKSSLASISAHPERLFDVIFPMMHGTFCEDGTIQGLLELADIPYVGCGVAASSIGMDKDLARRLASHSGVPIVPYLVIKKPEWALDAAALEEKVIKTFSLPLFVKPANQGSSIGVTKVKNQADLAAAIDLALSYDTKILVEQGINASEFEISVLESLEDGMAPFASKVGEVRPNDEFYSYNAKYKEGGAEFLIPAQIPEALQQDLRTWAIKIFNILGAEGMARIDFFVDKATKQIYFNEMNTIPGFTQTSMYPKMITASGITYSELLTRLVKLAIKRHEGKQQLQRSYI